MLLKENRCNKCILHVMFAILFAAMLFGSVSLSDVAGSKPNIVLMVIDDGGFADMPGMPGSRLTSTEMPALSRIVKGGLKFLDAHSAASICSPSRAALLTGREPRRTRVQHVLRPSSCGGIFPAEKTVAEALKGSGYDTAYVGKWHLGTVAPFHPTYQVFRCVYIDALFRQSAIT